MTEPLVALFLVLVFVAALLERLLGRAAPPFSDPLRPRLLQSPMFLRGGSQFPTRSDPDSGACPLCQSALLVRPLYAQSQGSFNATLNGLEQVLESGADLRDWIERRRGEPVGGESQVEVWLAACPNCRNGWLKVVSYEPGLLGLRSNWTQLQHAHPPPDVVSMVSPSASPVRMAP